LLLASTVDAEGAAALCLPSYYPLPNGLDSFSAGLFRSDMYPKTAKSSKVADEEKFANVMPAKAGIQ
jgi:hypothetical protein